MDSKKLKDSIRTIKDYPKAGILFYDITTMIGNGEVFGEFIESLKARYENEHIDFIVGIEARGFIFGAALANALKIGFIPIRKKGKLPSTAVSEKYALEYGFDEIEIHIDAFKSKKDARVVLVDDLIATGGTALASLNLIKSLNAQCIEACFLLNLVELGGAKKLQEHTRVFSALEI